MSEESFSDSEAEYVVARTADALRATFLADNDAWCITALIAWCERWNSELIEYWSRRVVSHPTYSGPITFRIYRDGPEIVTATAFEACSTVLRTVYVMVVPDQQTLWQSGTNWRDGIRAIESYVEANKEAIQANIDVISSTLIVDEWSRLAALSTVERIGVLGPTTEATQNRLAESDDSLNSQLPISSPEDLATSDETAVVQNAQRWKSRRQELGETVEDQMATLFKKDDVVADWAAEKFAEVLECSASTVKKKENKVWKLLQQEKERRKQALQRGVAFYDPIK